VTAPGKREGANILGIVVKVDKANSTSLMSSEHSRSMTSNSFDIYYVFSNELNGPYFNSELLGA